MFPRCDQELLSVAEGYSRREWLRIGGLGFLGLNASRLLAAEAALKLGEGGTGKSGSFGRAKSCLFIFMTGGPPQHETFDPKPTAPSEVRGPFGSIPTTIPGVHFSELIPHTARVARHLTVVRSLNTDIQSHSSSGYWMLTGYPHPAGQAETPASSEDWPSIASVVGALKPAERSPFSSVVLPEPIVNNPGVPWPGQTGGLMGATWHPHLFKCDPSSPQFELEGLRPPPTITPIRWADRLSLLGEVDRYFKERAASDGVAGFDKFQQQAIRVVEDGPAQRAFDLGRESERTRDDYGRHKFGQSLLLARRLIEAGVRLVQVNWPREPGDLSLGNPVWDTHQRNAERCKDVLCPTFDRSFATLILDMESRGLLEDTLVVVVGEFGRSPKINADGGRDHWGNCFSGLFAGAGTGGGRVLGASDAHGGYPVDRPIRPSEFAATLFHLLGVRPNAEFLDPLGRPRLVTDGGMPISELVGG